MAITADHITDLLNHLAKDDALYDRFVGAIETLSTPRQHDGHAPESLTVEKLAEDIAELI
ncbi:hypothetical protein [Streptomyces sp. DH12]|uniref:hypothetical protein n=1 Tax=Streptomyces sp. DH12 TaxID=2857010 RepID=UPI001E56D5ED|nr:hypothetical protein [Streptomyces sp. DH12]